MFFNSVVSPCLAGIGIGNIYNLYTSTRLRPSQAYGILSRIYRLLTFRAETKITGNMYVLCNWRTEFKPLIIDGLGRFS
jgi:hypothetical protein